MKHVFYLVLLCILVSATGKKEEGVCYSEKGIKTARTYAKFESADKTSRKDGEENYMEIHFDSLDQMISVKKISVKDTMEFYYQFYDNKLQRTLRKRNKITWGIYDTTGISMADWLKEMDTTHIVSHDESGLPTEMHCWDGTTTTWSHQGCEQETKITYNQDGSILQEQKLMKENGLLVLETTIVHTEPEWTSVIQYYDYKFNRHGHWIKRKYRLGGKGVVVEKRELEYY